MMSQPFSDRHPRRFAAGQWMRRHLSDGVLFFVILLTGWVFTFGVESFVDIVLYDESNYLAAGRTAWRGLPGAQGAPVYALWYAVLSLFRQDAIALFFVNLKAMTILPAAMTFCALRSQGVSRTVAWGAALWLLGLHANFATWPKVSHFVILVFLGGVCITAIVKSRAGKLAVAALAALVASYVRPEFYVSFLLFGLMLVVLSVRSMRERRLLAPGRPVVVVLVVGLLLGMTRGVPLGGGSRMQMAFGQHYARNWVAWHQTRVNPWAEWESIVRRDFGNCASPGAAMLANPTAMARHLSTNLRLLPNELWVLFRRHDGFPQAGPARRALMLTMILVLLTGLPLLGWARITGYLRQLRDNATQGRFAAVQIGVVLLPILLSVIIMAPRQHYVIMLGVGLVLPVVAWLGRTDPRRRAPSSFAHLVVLAITPLLIFRPLTEGGRPRRQPTLDTIRLLRSLPVNGTVNLLEAEGGYGIYVGPHYRRVAEYEKQIPFNAFLAERSINLIVLSKRLRAAHTLAADPEWIAFTNQIPQAGFPWRAYPGVAGMSLLIKRELLPQE